MIKSNQFPITPKFKKTKFSLFCEKELILKDVSYALCVWKRKEMKRHIFYKKKEFKIK